MSVKRARPDVRAQSDPIRAPARMPLTIAPEHRTAASRVSALWFGAFCEGLPHDFIAALSGHRAESAGVRRPEDYAAAVFHNFWLASRAPSAMAASFAQVIFGSTGTKAAKVAKPQSLPAMTLFLPATPA